MTNQDYIDSYKHDDRIISDYYKVRQDDKTVDVTGIVNPLKIDNRQLMAPTDNQKSSPHCAAYSAATLVESIYWKKTGKLIQLDSHQVYALAKQLDGQTSVDGTYLEAAMRAVLQLCRKDSRFSFLNDTEVRTFFNDRTEATVENVKFLLHKHDFLQVGFNIDEGWYDCNENNYVLKARGRICGGHAVNLCGYDSDGFFVLNQWGSSINGQSGWGAKGYAIMPYQLFLQQFMYGAYMCNIAY